MHLFSGEPPEHLMQSQVARPSRATGEDSNSEQRIAALEQEVSRLRTELTEVQQQLASFRQQFE
jgi:uncharacterized protein YceH (UPF0502 family)